MRERVGGERGMKRTSALRKNVRARGLGEEDGSAERPRDALVPGPLDELQTLLGVVVAEVRIDAVERDLHGEQSKAGVSRRSASASSVRRGEDAP